MMPAGIWMIELGQFTVLSAYLGEACPGLQVEQGVFRSQMRRNVQLRYSLILLVRKCWTWQEQFHEQVRGIAVALEELDERRRNGFQNLLLCIKSDRRTSEFFFSIYYTSALVYIIRSLA